MLPRSRSIFTLGEEESIESKTNSTIRDISGSSNKRSPDPIGLRILIHRSKGESNIVIKSALTLNKNTARTRRIPPAICQESSFLKACHRCHKQLSPNQDVYMYRGDQGFCSVECRCRQIYQDEMREIEASMKVNLSSSRQCGTSRRVREPGRPRGFPTSMSNYNSKYRF